MKKPSVETVLMYVFGIILVVAIIASNIMWRIYGPLVGGAGS